MSMANHTIAYHNNTWLSLSCPSCDPLQRTYTENCNFKEVFLENYFNAYSSAKWTKNGKEMFIALSQKGRPMRGKKTRREHVASHFIPMKCREEERRADWDRPRTMCMNSLSKYVNEHINSSPATHHFLQDCNQHLTAYNLQFKHSLGRVLQTFFSPQQQFGANLRSVKAVTLLQHLHFTIHQQIRFQETRHELCKLIHVIWAGEW